MTSLSLHDCSIRFKRIHRHSLCFIIFMCTEQWMMCNNNKAASWWGIIIHTAIEVELKYRNAHCHMPQFNYIDALFICQYKWNASRRNLSMKIWNYENRLHFHQFNMAAIYFQENMLKKPPRTSIAKDERRKRKQKRKRKLPNFARLLCAILLGAKYEVEC